MTSTTSGTATTCPATPTYNDASQLTARDGSITGWSYDLAEQRDRRRPGVRHRPNR
ncbi:hypothetical protein ACWFRQ_02300 [Streptomyces niveus]